jgi:hypothetical protein
MIDALYSAGLNADCRILVGRAWCGRVLWTLLKIVLVVAASDGCGRLPHFVGAQVAWSGCKLASALTVSALRACCSLLRMR